MMLSTNSTPIRVITTWHSLFPSSSACTSIEGPYGLPTQRERYRFTVFRISNMTG
jgi:hypothetical protein